MLTLPFQILTLLCLNEKEADVETESKPCLKLLTQITLKDWNYRKCMEKLRFSKH